MTIYRLAIVIVLTIASYGQINISGQIPTIPGGWANTGSFLTESFGDAGGPCGYGTVQGTIWNTGLYTQSGCNVIWGQYASGNGSITIGNSPYSTQYPIGPHSLLVSMIAGAGNYTYIGTSGFTPGLPNGSVYDVYGSVAIQTPYALGFNQLVPIVTLTDGSTEIVKFSLYPNGSGLVNFYCNSSSGNSGKSANLSTSTDYFFKIHVEQISSHVTSYCSVSTSFSASALAVQFGSTFQAGIPTKPYSITYIGNSSSQTPQTVSYSVGFLKIDSALPGQGNGPNLIVSPSLSTAQQLTSAAPLTTATVGGNGGSWTSVDSTSSLSGTYSYVSGGTATGTGTCNVTITGNSGSNATGTFAVSSGIISGALTITSAGGGYTSATNGLVFSLSNGTATCNGTATVNQSGGILVAAHPQSFSTASFSPLLSGVDVLGTYYGGPLSSDSLGIAYDVSKDQPSGAGFTYNVTTFSPVISVGYRLLTTMDATIDSNGPPANVPENDSTNNIAVFGTSGAYQSVNVLGYQFTNVPSVTQIICAESHVNSTYAANDCQNGMDWGDWFYWTPNTQYFVQAIFPKYSDCKIGMACLVECVHSSTYGCSGDIANGPFVVGETVTSTNGCTGTMLGATSGSPPTRMLYLTLTGITTTLAACATDTWIGSVSTATFSARRAPSNFGTLNIYDYSGPGGSCVIKSKQFIMNSSDGTVTGFSLKIGRSGDGSAPFPSPRYVNTNYFHSDWGRANVIPCR